MEAYNVVVTVHERHYQHGRHLLQEFGEVRETEFFNVLLMKVDSMEAFMEQLRRRSAEDASFAQCLSRVSPASAQFMFQTPEEFEARARQAVTAWLPALAGKTFHVRMHRRGFKGRLSSRDEERFLDDFLIESLQAAGADGHIGFTDPDVIIAVETVAQWAGLSCWTRDDLQRYPFLRLN
jgi:tRNA(Ser,Leu) C12 N-acetylase TAN1